MSRMYTLIVRYLDGPIETYTTRSRTEAYRIYDRAIDWGYEVITFSGARIDWRDRQG